MQVHTIRYISIKSRKIKLWNVLLQITHHWSDFNNVQKCLVHCCLIKVEAKCIYPGMHLLKQNVFLKNTYWSVWVRFQSRYLWRKTEKMDHHKVFVRGQCRSSPYNLNFKFKFIKHHVPIGYKLQYVFVYRYIFLYESRSTRDNRTHRRKIAQIFDFMWYGCWFDIECVHEVTFGTFKPIEAHNSSTTNLYTTCCALHTYEFSESHMISSHLCVGSNSFYISYRLLHSIFIVML